MKVKTATNQIINFIKKIWLATNRELNEQNIAAQTLVLLSLGFLSGSVLAHSIILGIFTLVLLLSWRISFLFYDKKKQKETIIYDQKSFN